MEITHNTKNRKVTEEGYNHPKNVFVASFIGSPAMNCFQGTLTRSEGGLSVKTHSFRLKIPDEKVKDYESHQDQGVILGIRPENIHDPKYAPPGIKPFLLEAKVLVTEMMGNEIIVYLNTSQNQEFVARVDPRSRLVVGEKVKVAIDLERFHLFDEATEQIIS